MTNLSKQICELCGIKPRYGVYKNFGDLDNNFQLVTNERKYRLIADTRHHDGVEDAVLRNLEPKYYPDFEQPENFVRLWEIISNQSKRELVQRLITRLRVEGGWYTDEIKQAIREEKWNFTCNN